MTNHGPYKKMADIINRMEPGQQIRISRRQIDDLPGVPDWAILSNITTGFERVKESILGANYPHLWIFKEELNGDITVVRTEENIRW